MNSLPMNDEAWARFWGYVEKSNPTSCWNWTKATTVKGYGAFQYKRNVYRAHRLAWSYLNGSIPDNALICHHCDNPRCCNPMHLFLGDNALNQLDCRTKGRARKALGERVNTAKMTMPSVILARKLYADGNTSHRQLAAKFHIGKSAMGRILNNQTWKMSSSTSGKI